MADNKKIDPDQIEKENAYLMWARFTDLVKYSTIAAVVVLVLMAVFLL